MRSTIRAQSGVILRNVTTTWDVRPNPDLLLEVERSHAVARHARVRVLADQVWAGVYRPPADAVAGALLDWAGDPFPATRTPA